jgi:putative ABC transport system permease protein
VEARDDADFVTRFLRSSLPFVSQRSRAIQTSVGGGVWAIAALATLAGLGLVGSAASLWSDRRRREVALLTVRGVSRGGIGVKAALELLPAIGLGAAAGVGLAYAVVAVLGPSPEIEPRAVVLAAGAGALALVMSVLAVGAVAASRATAPGAHRTIRWQRLAWVPWEAALVLTTVVSYRRLGEWGVPTGRGADVSRVDLWGLLFPVLFLVTAVALLARLLALLLRPLRAISQRWPFALYLGVRRVARYRVAAIGMVAGASLAAGVLGYAATMNRSLDTTLRAKGQTFVGSDVAVQLAGDIGVPDSVADRATEVRFFRRAWLQRDQREGVTVMAIDTRTFARGAFWDDTFASSDLPSILGRLADPGRGPVPAVVVGSRLDDQLELGVSGANTIVLDIAPIPGVRSFPGMKPQEATVFVDHRVLERLELRGGTTEAWVQGDRDAVLAELAAAGTGYVELRTLSGIADRASFRTVAWTFGFLQSIGVTAGLLVVGGLVVYLDARRRDRVLGYAFMQRMGLRRVQHRLALAVELTASVLVGAVMGLGLSVATATLAHRRIDPVPRYAPEPLLRHATGMIVGLLATTVVLTVVAAILGQRQVDADDPVEVIRAGT